MTIGKRIKKLRKSKDLTQQEFGEKIGSTQNAIGNYETGHRNPSGSVINNICKTFNISETWLRTGEGEMFRQLSQEEEAIDFIHHVFSEEGNTFKKQFVSALPKLSELDWSALEHLIQSIKKD